MHKRCRIVVGLMLLAISVANHLNAAELSFVLGSIVEPDGVNEGDTLPPGTVVQTGSAALAIVEHRWPSDIQGRDCILVAIFGYGQSYTVSESGTPGRCETTVPTNPTDFQPGQPFLDRETRYGDAKFDEPKIPDKVSTSQSQWRTFDQWLRDAQRTFTGIVTSVTSNRIRVRSPSSNLQRQFSVNPSTVDSPVALDTLIDRSVRLDYQTAGGTLQAVRIRLTSPPQVAPGNESKTKLPKTKIPQRPLDTKPAAEKKQPSEKTPPTGTEPKPDETGKFPDQPADAWTCKIDLHQGDTGTLEFSRNGGQIEGVIVISRGPQKHAISGTWKGDAIEFWRSLSKGSGQPFTGNVTKGNDGVVRMAGRFANEYRGVWSADCTPGWGHGATGSAQSSERYDVVLTGFGESKIAVIKVVREVTGLGLKEAKEAVENSPFTVKAGLSADDAIRLAGTLQSAGALVSIDKTK